MTRYMSCVLLLIMGACTLPWALAQEPVPRLEADVRTLTLERAGKNPAVIGRDRALVDIARGHSRAMHRAGKLSHELNGVGPEQRLAREHRSLFGLVSENVAMQQSSVPRGDVAERLVDGWMQSPGHRANILSDYDAFEVGCHGDRRTVYCTQLFVRATTRLANEVGFHQSVSGQVTVELAQPPGERVAPRISIERAGATASDPGVVLQNGLAELPLPDRPGLYQLKLWTPHEGDPSRYRIIGGPYVCATTGGSPARAPRSCRSS